MSEKAKLQEIAAAEEMSVPDCDKLHRCSLTTEDAKRAKAAGISLVTILRLVNQYGPQVVTILRDLLNYLKPFTPPVTESQPK